MKIGIAGLGLIGGSMAKAFKFRTENEVYGFDIDEGSFKRAVLVGAVDGRLNDSTISDCDLIIVALYPEATVNYICSNASKFKKDAIVVDCCGVKEYVCKPCFDVAEAYGFEYYGGHPMAGTQYSGFANAKENMFAGASMIIVPKNTDDIFKLDRVKSIFKILLVSSLVYSVTLWLAVMIFPRAFAAILTPDAALLDFTVPALRIYCAVLCIFGVQVACQMTFVSLGKAFSSVIVAVMRKFVLLLPLIYIVPCFFEESMKTTAVYLAEPIADFLAVSFTAILFAFQFKKAIRSIDDENKINIKA